MRSSKSRCSTPTTHFPTACEVASCRFLPGDGLSFLWRQLYRPGEGTHSLWILEPEREQSNPSSLNRWGHWAQQREQTTMQTLKPDVQLPSPALKSLLPLTTTAGSILFCDVSDPCLGGHCTTTYYYRIVKSAPIDLQSPPPVWEDLEGRKAGSQSYLCPCVLNRAWHRAGSSLDQTDKGRDFSCRVLPSLQRGAATLSSPPPLRCLGQQSWRYSSWGSKVDLIVLGRKASTEFLITP